MSTPPTQPHDAPAPTRDLHARDVFRFLRRGAPLALLVALAAGVAAFLVARNSEPTFRATVALLAAEPTAGFGDVEVVVPSRVDPGVYRTAVVDGPVLADALQRVDGERPSERELEAFLRTMDIDVENQDVSSVIRISVDHADPTYAAVVANTIADSLVAWDRDRARRGAARSLAAIETSIAQIDEELRSGGEAVSADRREALLALREQRSRELDAAQAGDEPAVAVARLEPLRVAAPPEEPVAPRPVFDTFVAFVIGLVATYAILLLRQAFDRRVAGREDLHAITAAPLLAEFPRRSRGSRARIDEAHGFFHTNLLMAARGLSPLTVVVTSPRAVEEKDAIAVGLAESFARGGHRTLLIDGDLRRPGTTEGLDVKTKQSAPFEIHLANPERRYAPATVAIGGKATFDFVPSFTAAEHPVELLNKGLAARMRVWREEYDVVIVDGTPVLPYADALAMAAHCDGVVLCVRSDETTRDQVQESLDLLARNDVPVLGTVLTNASARARAMRPAGSDASRARPKNAEAYRTLPRAPERTARSASERR